MPNQQYILNAIRNGYVVAVNTEDVANAIADIEQDGLTCHVVPTDGDDKKQINPGPSPDTGRENNKSISDAGPYEYQLFVVQMQQLEKQDVLQSLMADYALSRGQVSDLCGHTVDRSVVDRWLQPFNDNRWYPVSQVALDKLCASLDTTYDTSVLKYCRPVLP